CVTSGIAASGPDHW
nr:immunoglobulin heavy chain junction region [Macaca mulatta]